MAGHTILVLLLAGSLAAFGGIYPWALPGMLLGALALTAAARRGTLSDPPEIRALDWGLLALVAAVALQLVPLPEALRATLSPHASIVLGVLRPDAAFGGAVAAQPLSVRPSSTWAALGLLIATVLTYRGARAVFAGGGVRAVCHAIGIIAAVAGVAALVQRAVSPDLIYGFWQPQDIGARPFGPVVNRNHFAGWLVMASAVTGGYLIARIGTRMSGPIRRRTWRRTVTKVAASGALWTGTAWLITAATIAGAQSRSAMIAFLVSIVTLSRAVRVRWNIAQAGIIAMALLLLAVATAGVTDLTRTTDRFAEMFEPSDVSRLVIWEETLPIVRDFWATGVGAGAFGTAMIPYQRTRAFAEHLRSGRHFNHAHNHYLQLAAEGGALVTVPFVIVVALFIRVARQRLAAESGELRAVRYGACGGLLAIAVQSVWEVPLTMPAAALLASTLAAMVTYRRER